MTAYTLTPDNIDTLRTSTRIEIASEILAGIASMLMCECATDPDSYGDDLNLELVAAAKAWESGSPGKEKREAFFDRLRPLAFAFVIGDLRDSADCLTAELSEFDTEVTGAA